MKIAKCFRSSGEKKKKQPGRTPKRILNEGLGRNDLKPYAYRYMPELYRVEKLVNQHIGLPLYMTGSGSTLFMPVSTLKERETIVKTCKEMLPSCWVSGEKKITKSYEIMSISKNV